MRQPSVLLLDEATSALDSGAEHQVNQAISTILSTRSITVVVIAHRLATVARAERVIVLEKGRVTEEGTYADLVSTCPHLALAPSQNWTDLPLSVPLFAVYA